MQYNCVRINSIAEYDTLWYAMPMTTKKINPLHLDQQLCFALYSAARLMIQAYNPLLEDLQVTYPQYLVLLVLWEQDGLSVNEIGSKLLLDSGTLSPLLKKLEEKLILKRCRQVSDERVVIIELTAEGKALQKKAGKIPSSMFCQIALKDKEFSALRSQLQMLTKNLNS